MEMLRSSTVWQDMERHRKERLAWEAEHPELAAAWNEAHEENDRRKEETDKRQAAEARARQVRAEAPKRLVSLGAPLRAVEVWQAGGETTQAVRYVDDFLASGKTFLVLTGSAGAGKTVAAVHGMAARLLEDKHGFSPAVLFVRASECARLGLYSEEDKALTRQMHAAGLLVVDDMGAEFMSEGSVWRGLLDELIDVRYGESAPTIITTNLSGEAFKERYGERVADRIRHAGAVMGCGQSSMRKRGEG